MNEAHWHLAVNHFPLIAPILGVLVMLGGFIFKSAIVRRVAYLIFILSALTAIAAYQTGEGAEEIVEEMDGRSHDLIHVHEEATEIYAILVYILGGISLIGLWLNWKAKPLDSIVGGITILYTAILMYYGQDAATTGGEISHPEIRDDFHEIEQHGESEHED